jgi:hypothetical protein
MGSYYKLTLKLARSFSIGFTIFSKVDDGWDNDTIVTTERKDL